MPEERVTRDPDGELVISTPLISQLQSLRSEQAAGFAKLDTKLDGKAEKSDVARLEKRLDDHQGRINQVEEWKRVSEVTRSTILTRREKFWGGIGVGALVLASLLAPVVDHLLAGH